MAKKTTTEIVKQVQPTSKAVEIFKLDELTAEIALDMENVSVADLIKSGFKSEGFLVKVPVGASFRAIYDGPGREIQMSEKNGGGIKRTWKFHPEGKGDEIALCIIGDHNLDSHMSNKKIGSLVVATRNDLTSIGGGRTVNNWTVFTKEPGDVIDAK